MDEHYLSPLFSPEGIAVFAGPPPARGAHSPQARALFEVLGSGGTEEPRYSDAVAFLDVHTSGTLADLAQTRADLAILALPHGELEAALEIAARIRCKSALILSSGIDADLARRLRQQARREGMALLGPNSLGFQRPHLKLNASALGPISRPGSLALVSQSGALSTAILDWAASNGVGFSTVVSLGAHSGLDVADVLDFLATDRHTQGIVCHLEGIGNARRFMSALRAAAHSKPVVVLKAGRKPGAQAAAATHSASIVGSDDVFDAALRRAGAVRVRSFVELFSAAQCLASRYRAVGPRLAVITNGGGPGVLAADAIQDRGMQLGRLSEATRAELATQLPAGASLAELVDLSEEASPVQYQLALKAAARDSQIDGVLVIHCPKAGTDSAGVAQTVAAELRNLRKPMLACWMGDAAVSAARQVFGQAQIPVFRAPEAAVGAFANIATFHINQQLLQQTPPPLSHLAKPDLDGARLVIEGVLAERRHVLTEMESKTLLAAFHIPVTPTVLARSSSEAVMIATQMGFPIALKIDSPDVVHKSDVQGVALGLTSATQVRDAFTQMMLRVQELLPQARLNGVTVQRMAPVSKKGGRLQAREVCVGLITDDPFGPVITFGAGGTMIELIDDHAMALPPLNQYLARRLIEQARVAETLGEWRGAEPADVQALEHILLRVSEMVCELPQLREMDLNPIIVSPDGAVAVDARIVVQAAPAAATHYGHLAILPYPTQLDQRWPLPGDDHFTIRPIRPDDAQMLQTLVKSLSSESRYFRFVSSMKELPPSMLARFTLIDYDREMALIAQHGDRVIGVSRYITNPDSHTCEFSLVVADDWGGRGIGSRLMMSLQEVARDKGLQEIVGIVLTQNGGMIRLMSKLGYSIKPFDEDPDFVLVSLAL